MEDIEFTEAKGTPSAKKQNFRAYFSLILASVVLGAGLITLISGRLFIFAALSNAKIFIYIVFAIGLAAVISLFVSIIWFIKKRSPQNITALVISFIPLAYLAFAFTVAFLYAGAMKDFN